MVGEVAGEKVRLGNLNYLAHLLADEWGDTIAETPSRPAEVVVNCSNIQTKIDEHRRQHFVARCVMIVRVEDVVEKAEAAAAVRTDKAARSRTIGILNRDVPLALPPSAQAAAMPWTRTNNHMY